MTTEIEKQFFQCFEIEPKYEDACRLADAYWQDEELANEYGIFDYFMEFSGCQEKEIGCTDECRHAYSKTIYPQITDRILLELIRIIGFITIKYTNEQCEICYGDGAISYLGKDLKEAILNFLISKVSIFKHQVRTLFKEVEE